MVDACRRHIVGHRRCHQTQDSTRRPHLGYGRGRDVWRGRRVSTANGQTLDTQRVGLHRTARVVRARGSNGRRFPPSHDFLRELNYLFYPSVGGGNSFQTNGKKKRFFIHQFLLVFIQYFINNSNGAIGVASSFFILNSHPTSKAFSPLVHSIRLSRYIPGKAFKSSSVTGWCILKLRAFPPNHEAV